MKRLLLLIGLTIGFISHANAGTITIARGENLSPGEFGVVLYSANRDSAHMYVEDGEEDKTFYDVSNGKYDAIRFMGVSHNLAWIGGYVQRIGCDKLMIKVTHTSRHIIILNANFARRTVTCQVKDD